jgi:hypothetical protein
MRRSCWTPMVATWFALPARRGRCSMYNRLLLAIAVAFVWTSGAASAAPLLSVSYEVTGGSFSGDWSSGAITSGTLAYSPTVPTSTPFTASGEWILSLNGPSGSFRVTFLASARVYADEMIPVRYYTYPSDAWGQVVGPVYSNGQLLVPAPGGVDFDLRGGAGPPGPTTWVGAQTRVPPDFWTTLFFHRFTVGTEVRTFVPEPATGTLVGLGLVFMGFVGGSRRAAAHARRVRRA